MEGEKTGADYMHTDKNVPAVKEKYIFVAA